MNTNVDFSELEGFNDMGDPVGDPVDEDTESKSSSKRTVTTKATEDSDTSDGESKKSKKSEPTKKRKIVQKESSDEEEGNDDSKQNGHSSRSDDDNGSNVEKIVSNDVKGLISRMLAANSGSKSNTHKPNEEEEESEENEKKKQKKGSSKKQKQSKEPKANGSRKKKPKTESQESPKIEVDEPKKKKKPEPKVVKPKKGEPEKWVIENMVAMSYKKADEIKKGLNKFKYFLKYFESCKTDEKKEEAMAQYIYNWANWYHWHVPDTWKKQMFPKDPCTSIESILGDPEDKESNLNKEFKEFSKVTYHFIAPFCDALPHHGKDQLTRVDID